MKAYVITIMDNEQSVNSAERCIRSGKKYGQEIEKHKAFTPKDNPFYILHTKGIQPSFFSEKYSRQLNCAAAFLSHHSLWEKAVKENESIMIFEHDAVVIGYLPTEENFKGVMTFSKPSYGRFNTPIKIGVDGLKQKPYFGGAHGYMVNPWGAKQLIDKAKTMGRPTDVYLNLETFPWLEEYYPWACMAVDGFTTIQKEEGCQAKHNYKDGYEIIDA